MIRFLLSRGHAYTHKRVKRSPLAPRVAIMHYDALFRARRLSAAVHIFTDLDRLSYFDLELASEMYQQLKASGMPVFNDPAVHKGRHSLLRALHVAGLNDFDAYRVNELDAVKRYPVFLRRMQGHREPLTDLLHTADEMRKAVSDAVAAGVPAENLLIIEAVHEPVRPGLFRKLAVFRIGSRIVPHIPVHDHVWLVKYGRTMADIEDLYVQEYADNQGNRDHEHLRRVFQIAGVEYGRADYAFYKGRIQVFEINTNPHLSPGGGATPPATRMATMKQFWEQYMSAMHEIDGTPGRSVRLADAKLQRYRTWKNMFVRTRKVH